MNGPWALPLRSAYKIEQTARGHGSVPWWYRYVYGAWALQLNHGLAQLVKGHPGAAREIWRKTLEENPNGRWLRLHLDVPGEFLDRMMRMVPGPAGA